MSEIELSQDVKLFLDGRTSLSSARDHLRALATNRSNLRSIRFQLDLRVAQSAKPNAFAAKAGDLHVGGVHSGLSVVILEIALFALAQADILPTIGLAGNELSPLPSDQAPPGLSLLLKTLEHGGVFDMPDVDFIMPVDQERHVHAHYLALLALRFVWFHEIGHCILGHIDYLQERSASRNANINLDELHLSEVLTDSLPVDARVLQCLEFEADSWALSKSLSIQHHDLENIDGIAALPRRLRLRTAVLGAYMTIWLLESMAAVSKRGRLAISHPAPLRRLQMLQNIAASELKRFGDDAVASGEAAAGDFDRLISKIGRQWQQTDKFEPIVYRAVFDQLRQDLAPYRYLSPDDH